MTISTKMLNDKIVEISETNTLLDMLLEFEGVLDDLDLYAFKNWDKGEILEGPTVERHFVGVKLLYPYKDMPDPEGAKRLLARDCLVDFKRDTLISPRRIKTFDDVEVDIRPDGSQRYKAKTKSEPVWVVNIQMPRRFVDEFASEKIQTADSDEMIDQESVDTAAQIDNQQLNQGLI